MTRGTRCGAHKHRHPVPQEHHHLQPLSRGGTTTPDNMIWLCANAHSDTHYYLDLIEHARGLNVPTDLAKHYSHAVRRIAAAGWRRYADQYIGGFLATEATLWKTSGQPTDLAPETFGPWHPIHSPVWVDIAKRTGLDMPIDAEAARRAAQALTGWPSPPPQQ